jgi:hypothetical protein
MKAGSVIDKVATGSTAANARGTVTLGGIAHAGARLVDRVEVQMDDGA